MIQLLQTFQGTLISSDHDNDATETISTSKYNPNSLSKNQSLTKE